MSNANNDGSFESLFRQRIEDIYSRSQRAGVSITKLAEEAGVTRLTLSRWRRKAPKTVLLVDMFEGQLKKAEAAKAE